MRALTTVAEHGLKIDATADRRSDHGRGEAAVGKPLDRVDGRLKVTGGPATPPRSRSTNVAYGVLVLSTIARGKVTNIDTAAAEKAPGVLAVITHRNAAKVPLPEEVPRHCVDPDVGQPLQPLQDDLVHYNGQPIAVVVADTFEQATHAAALVRVDLRRREGRHRLRRAPRRRFPPTSPRAATAARRSRPTTSRGEPDKAFADAAVQRRADLHASRRAPQPDGAARHRRRLGRAEAHPVRQDAVGR